MRISETAIKAAVPPVFLVRAVFKLFSFLTFRLLLLYIQA